jgi:formamidopyrimidine-DNA glycosylase
MKPEEREMWPPKFWKFHLFTDDPDVEVAYTDPRRFGRIRLVDCPGSEIRKHPPLSENGPDPVVDPDIFTYHYLLEKTRHRHVPIKALLLDQAMISGIGNWVGDEVMYHARLHPEQYCDEFSDEEIQKLYNSIRYVCQTAVDNLADSDKFPEDWLFRHRWNKGSKDATNTLPNGEKLSFITVGGRTSCFAPRLQKKTGHIPAGAKEESYEQADDKSTEKSTKQKSVSMIVMDEASAIVDKKQMPKRGAKAKQGVTNGADSKAEDGLETPRMKRKRAETNQTSKAEASDSPRAMQRVKSEGASSGRRRSGRLSAKGA